MIYKAKVRETEHLEVYKQVGSKARADTHGRVEVGSGDVM